jgi:hypothetical protein
VAIGEICGQRSTDLHPQITQIYTDKVDIMEGGGLVDTLTGLYSRHSRGLQAAGRGALVVLLACMPWAVLSPEAGPPSHWAGGMHVGALAMLSVPACVSFTSPWSRAGAVMFVFGYSGLMEVLQHFSAGRTGSWEDLGMNAVGVLIGVGLAKWALDCWNRRNFYT